MITGCPHCRTQFAITAEQLSAKAGLVRCGACRNVFNGYRGLVLTAPAVAPAAASAAPAALLSRDVNVDEVPTAVAASGALAIPLAVEAEKSDNTAAAMEVSPLAANVEDAFGSLTSSASTPASDAHIPAPEEPSVDVVLRKRASTSLRDAVAPEVNRPLATRAAEPLYRPELHTPRISVAWVVASVVLLLVLAAQAAFFWRGWLAQRWPEARAPLEAACATLNCTVPFARDLPQLNIDASALEADPLRPGVYTLQATLQNLASFVQTYPHLELTLTGVNDEPLAVKVFGPKDYLSAAPGDAIAIGWLPKKTQSVNLHLDASKLPPAGFRLRLIYP